MKSDFGLHTNRCKPECNGPVARDFRYRLYTKTVMKHGDSPDAEGNARPAAYEEELDLKWWREKCFSILETPSTSTKLRPYD